MGYGHTHDLTLPVAVQDIVFIKFTVIGRNWRSKIHIHDIGFTVILNVQIICIAAFHSSERVQNIVHHYFCHTIFRFKSWSIFDVKKAVIIKPSFSSSLYTTTNSLSGRLYTDASNSLLPPISTTLGLATESNTSFKFPAISGWFSTMCTIVRL